MVPAARTTAKRQAIRIWVNLAMSNMLECGLHPRNGGRQILFPSQKNVRSPQDPVYAAGNNSSVNPSAL